VSHDNRRDDLSGRHVAVVGMNYAPEPTGIAPYTAGLAEMLVEAGARVTVVTGVPHYPTWTVDPEYRWSLRVRERRHGVDVIRARHFVPRRQSVGSLHVRRRRARAGGGHCVGTTGHLGCGVWWG